MPRTSFSNSATRTPASKFLIQSIDSVQSGIELVPDPVVDPNPAVPDVHFPPEFIETAITGTSKFDRFGVFIIQLDIFFKSSNLDERDTEQDTRFENRVSSVIESMRLTADDIWQPLSPGYMGCCVMDIDAPKAYEFALGLKEKLFELNSDTISVGIACYPQLEFSLLHVLDNGCKALHHARFFGPSSVVSFDAVSLNISADRLYQKGDITGAIKEFNAALEIDQENINVHNSLGVCYGVLGRFDEAKAAFTKTIALDNAEVMAIFNLGLIYLLTGEREQALKLFHQAHKYDRHIFEVVSHMGRAYFESGDITQSMVYFQEALGIRPESGPVLRSLGDCYAALDRIDEAIVSYQNAIRQNPYDAGALSALGRLFEMKGENLDIAVVFAEESTQIAPENGLYHKRLAKLLLRQKRFASALAELQKAADLGVETEGLMTEVQQALAAGAG